MNWRDAVIGVLLSIVLTVVLIATEAFEAFYAFSRAHEDWEIDELALTAIAVLVGALVSALLTARRRARRLLEQQEQLSVALREAALASQAKSRFLASMSHEFRTPLNAIIGFSELLANDELHRLPPSQRQHVGHVISAGHQLLRLVDELIEFARIDKIGPVLDVRSVDIQRLAGECVAAARATGPQREVTYSVDVPAETHVLADRARLRQVLRNLLENAATFNTRAGAVRVTATADDAGTVAITVADTGRGIPAQRLAELFEPFNRLGLEGGSIPGAGVGLAIAKLLVEAMGGTIEANSREGQGTAFTVRLPRAPTSAQAPVPDVIARIRSAPPPAA